MERGENRARFIAIRLKINIFPRPFARVPSFKIPPFTGASNKQRTGKYFDEYIYHSRERFVRNIISYRSQICAELMRRTNVIFVISSRESFDENKFLRFPLALIEMGERFG